jgi:hypothetical protein
MQDIFKNLRKHYFISLIGFFGLLLLGIGGYVSVKRYQVSTPIARIEPKDSLEAAIKGSKLDMYKKENEQEEKQAYQRKMAMDEIIAIDFSGRADKHTANRRPNDKTKQSQPLNRKTDTLLQYSQPLLKPHVPSKPVRQKQSPAIKPLTSESAADGFYTIKANEKEDNAATQIASQAYYKALIFGNQKLQVNAAVRIRLEDNLRINGLSFPENTILTGRVSGQTNGRLKINISQIEGVRVNLQVHDQDYTEGIAYQTKEVVSEVASEAGSEAVDEILSSLPYGGIAGGLARLGKSATRKTRRNVTLFLADGYRIFLTATH